ncbi:hypothetical protein GCM10009827_016060 [Dactylosporangium maewongense]|uniref:Uncharacterized protein n=1 Tax=Dactylosporangium maewongense TaxID=634393 RepID=A0ABN1UP34_9ACTN
MLGAVVVAAVVLGASAARITPSASATAMVFVVVVSALLAGLAAGAVRDRFGSRAAAAVRQSVAPIVRTGRSDR